MPLQEQDSPAGRNARVSARSSRLESAYECGYLDATASGGRALLQAFGLWCWRMKVPMIWFERLSPRSKFSRISVEFFTTWFRLSADGLASVKAACGEWDCQVNADQAVFRRVPSGKVEVIAVMIRRLVTRAGSCEASVATRELPVLQTDEKLAREDRILSVRARRPSHKSRSRSTA